MATYTPMATNVVQSFSYNSPMALLTFGRSLARNEARSANFFTRHGMITKTMADKSVNTPLHQVEDFEGNTRKGVIRTFIADILRGTPQVSADDPAATDARTIPQTEFEFKTIDMYGPVLDVPASNREYTMTISIFGNYATQLRQWWQAVVENLIWVYLTGMRGQGQNWRAIDAIQGDGAKAATSDKDAFTPFMDKINAYNPISKPQKQMATWASTADQGKFLPDSAGSASNKFNPGAAVTPGSTNAINFSLINRVKTLLSTRSTEREGIGLEKPEIRNMPNGKRTGWTWIIPPEVAMRIRETFADLPSGKQSAVEWQDLELAKAEGGKSNGFETGWIGGVFGVNFTEADSIPRYRGGSAGDVAVARTLILCKNALAFGFRTQEIRNDMLGRFNHMGKTLGRYAGAVYHCWIEPVNSGRKSVLQSKCDFGVRKVRYKLFNSTKEVDKGVVAIDVPYTSLETDSNVI